MFRIKQITNTNELSLTFLSLFPFLSTALYSLSFPATYTSEALAWSSRIGLAAGISWLFFGLILHFFAHLSFRAIFELCLKIMFKGNLVLLFSVLINIMPFTLTMTQQIVVHGLVLCAANVVMACKFCILVKEAHVDVITCTTYWNYGLNGTFGIILLLLTFYWRPI